jgi:putative membrane protein
MPVNSLVLAAKGIILGIIVVLPGMSGGTLLLILGLYKDLLADISRWRFLPYVPFIVGLAGGIYVSGLSLTYLFMTYRNFASVLLLGSVLASIKAVVGTRPVPNSWRVALGVAGLALGFAMAGEPMGLSDGAAEPGVLLLLIGGALGSATMLVPGLPGSSVLIVMGIYDDVLRYLAVLDFLRLGIFTLGSLAGVLALARLLDMLYNKYRLEIGWFFSGLIIGSARMLLPVPPFAWLSLIIAFFIGFAVVWIWCDYRTE